MIRYTVDDIMKELPCSGYTRERVVELWAGRDGLTPREIASLDIPVDDRIWALSRMLYLTSPHAANRIARIFALSVVHMWDCPDLVYWYLVSGDDSARDAALAAALAAARDAALAAALDAALAAALAAARDAARDAAWAAARDAAWAAAWAASLEQHIETLVGAWEVHP